MSLRRGFIVVLVGMALLSSGCALLGAKEKELGDQLSQCKAERDRLVNQKSECEKKQTECLERVAVTEKSRITLILFGGDIIFEVSATAFKDYKSSLRYRTLNDSHFADKVKLFDTGMGGDAEMLAVLKEMDTSGDKLIDTAEAAAFRKAEEDKYSAGKTPPPAK